MQQDGEDPGEAAGGSQGPAAGLHLRRLPGGGQRAATPAAIRLLREYKGLTVRELTADLELGAQLPGRVRSALEAIARGDLAAAEAALPGRFASVLPGPGHRPRASRRRWIWLLCCAALAATVALARIML